MAIKATLCILMRREPALQVLLGYKKTGFGQGKYTGFGGKVEPGESVVSAAQRELAEETSIRIPIENFLFAGVLTFLFPNQPAWDQEVHVYRVDDWQGEPVESSEMKPEWFNVDDLPFDRMWDDGRYWLPPVLAGLPYSARFSFKDDNATVGKVELAHATPAITSPPSLTPLPLTPLLASNLLARLELLSADPLHESTIRLFNGFLEGRPELAADVYADTLVLHNHANPPEMGYPLIADAQAFYLAKLPWIKTVVIKSRTGSNPDAAEKRGRISFGGPPARKIREHGVWYALDLLLHQDATFYPDTRGLRAWAIDHLAGKRVLNTFAYTGSLGVAALAGSAQQVIQLDRNRAYLDLAKTSYTLNGFPIQRDEFLSRDFFPQIGALKRDGLLFDCIFLDPPFFSVTDKGKVDLVTQSTRLINKVRPLVADDGWLVAVNNALFVSGRDYLHMLEGLCTDGYLTIEELIPIPPDCAGYPHTCLRSLPADPAPFNHATKIAVLRVRRKPTAFSTLDDRQE
jgi:23S rRNA (cytosine1962-C5)-methyltransferase